MTAHRFLIATILLLLLPVVGSARIAHPSPTAQEGRQEFRERFRKAMEIQSIDEMARLFKSNEAEAIVWVMEVCESIAERSSEELENLAAAHRKAWVKAFDTRFPVKVYEYFSLLDPKLKRERAKLRERYDKQRDRYIANLEKKDGPTFQLLAGEFAGLADAFAQLGDQYYASECWVFTGLCYSEQNRGEDADKYQECLAYGKALEARRAIDLEDRTYKEVKLSYDHLVAQGYDKPPGEAGGEGGGGAAEEAAPAQVATMTFERIAKITDFQRPNYNADEFYQIWDALSVGAVGGETKFAKLGDLSPKVIRTADSEMKIDTDGDGKGDLVIPFTGNFEPITFEIGQGEEKRTWGVIAVIGVQNDLYQDIQVNLAPATENCTVYYLNAASVVGMVDGVPVRVIDDNLDGVYGSPPKSWQNIGLTKDHYQPELDSIVIGEGKRAQPWSEYQKIGANWYKLEARKGGKELAYAPVAPKTGWLKLKFKGPAPSYVVLKGDGKYENSYFDIARTTGKGAEVPVGKYTLFYGEVRKGKRRQMMKTLILQGDGQGAWKVEEGKVTTVQLGGPFGFDFRYELNGEELTIPGSSVCVIGAAGERYERPWRCVPLPQVYWRKDGTKRAVKAETMKALVDTDPIYEKGYGVAWFPLDLTIHVQPGPEGVDVQLVEKKNKLFGKVQSEWRD